ncbi:hypothetical protein ACQ1ZE_14865, partial [Enterococcus faecalis]
DIAPNVQPGTQYAELIELAHDHLRGQSKRSGKDFTFDDLCAEMALRAESLDLKKPTVNTAISRVKALSSNPLIGERFDFVEELKKNRL